MSNTSPPLEAQRFGRSQTPESPRPIAIPEPSNIPVLQNQMDPIFNDTATYDIRPDSQPSTAQKNASSDSSELHYEDLNAKSRELQQTLLNDHAEAELAQTRATSSLTAKNVPVPISQQAEHTVPSTLANPANTYHHISQVTKANEGVPELADHDSQAHLATSHTGEPKESAKKGESGGVDYESILASIDAPTIDNVPISATDVSERDTQTVSAVQKQLPAAIGLPPKPPLPEKPTNFTEYNRPDVLGSSYHPSSSTVAVTSHVVDASHAAPKAVTNGLPPPPALPSQQPGGFANQLPAETHMQNAPGYVPQPSETERPWGPEIQQIYDRFLDDERMYVTEGVWDKFPVGSRLFVGNLPTEKVTKRDLFHIFHKYGQLAQISIKQAYGFVQFLQAADCQAALQAEQGVELRDRLLHLEISKPQKNARNANSGGNRGAQRRRSRSPARSANQISNDRGGYGGRPPYSDFRDEPVRRRDDYRPIRSPSPRNHRRDEYRSRDDRYSGAARSPQYGNNPFPSATPPSIDDDALLPLPRRDPRDVPDVQLLVIEDVGHPLVNFLEQAFRNKGLAVQTVWLNPRLTLGAVVKRQIIEGVQAVVKLTRNLQYSSKIPLQVFDRTLGTTNVNFNEYADLDVNIAADIIIQARQKERLSAQRPISSLYPSQQGFQQTNAPTHFQNPVPTPQIYGHTQPQYQHTRTPGPQYPQPPHQQYGVAQQSPQTPNGGGSNLQELLANLNRQPPSNAIQIPQQSTPTQQSTSDLAGLLQNVAARQQNQANGLYGHGQSFNATQPPFAKYPSPQQNSASQQYVTPTQHTQQNVQNIMDQLARYNR